MLKILLSSFILILLIQSSFAVTNTKASIFTPDHKILLSYGGGGGSSSDSSSDESDSSDTSDSSDSGGSDSSSSDSGSGDSGDGSYGPGTPVFTVTGQCAATPPYILISWAKPNARYVGIFKSTNNVTFTQIFSGSAGGNNDPLTFNDTAVTPGGNYYYRLEFYDGNHALKLGPYYAQRTNFCTIPPGTITMTASPACIPSSGDTGSSFTFSWTNTNRAVTWADIGTASTFGTYYHKAISGGLPNQSATVTGPSGFNGFVGASGPLTLFGGTTYYVRVFNGLNGPTPPFSFNIPICAGTPQVNIYLNNWPHTEPVRLNVKQNDPVTISWNSVNTSSCTATIPAGSTTPAADLSAAWSGAKGLSGSQNLPAISTVGTYLFTLTCTNISGGNISSTATLIVTQLQKPFFKTTGGDVHTNESITIPRIMP